MHASFVRAARRNSENFACLPRDFQRIFAQNLHALGRRTRTFSNPHALPIHSRAAATPCNLRSAHWPKARICSCARHTKILKILHFFYANFAAKCASSRFLTCAFFEFQCTADSVNSCSDAMGTLADGPQILCARCAEIPEFLQFFRAILAPILRDLDAERTLFRI